MISTEADEQPTRSLTEEERKILKVWVSSESSGASDEEIAEAAKVSPRL